MRRFAVVVSVLAAAICLGVAPVMAQSQSASPHPAASAVPQLGSNEVVVYARSDRDGDPVSLYAVGADGAPRLLSPAPINCCATVSPDGTLVAFESPSADGKHAETGLVRTDGSGLRLLASPDGGDLSPGLFLPDGRLAAVTWKDDGPGPTSLLIMDPVAADPLSTATRIDGVFDTPLSVSPDGTKMLLALAPEASTPGQLLVIDTDGSGQHPVGPQAVNVSDDPFWGPAAEFSRDGTQITFSTGHGGQRTTYVANADGSNVTSIGSSLTGAHWSPAQDFLAIDRQVSGGNGIVIVRPDGSEIATLASGGAFAPIWSPDGTRLVIQQGIGTDNLSIVDLAGQEQQITNDSGMYAWVGWGKLPSPGQATPGTPSASPTETATTEPAAMAPCTNQPGAGDPAWLCGTLAVPVDRADPTSGTIDLAYYVLPHTDQSTPAGIPLFVTPGGPGGRGFDSYALYAMQPLLHANHDIVTIDPRGTGRSDAIDCPDIQTGAETHDEMVAAVEACGRQLGTASGRYGSADRATDVEAVRAALGYPLINYYGASYGGVDVQAYAARFPDRLHALVLDSTFPVNDAAHIGWTGLSAAPTTLVHVAALECTEDPSCASLAPDPEATLDDLIERLRDHPVDGTPKSSSAAPLHLDDLAMAYVLGGGAHPQFMISDALALQKGDSQRLINLANSFRPFTYAATQVAPTTFSAGANIAGSCNDQDTAWNRDDPVPARAEATKAYLASLPADTFAPFSAEAWTSYYIADLCLDWPAPVNFTPVVPAGTSMPSIPVLLLGGDRDVSVPLGYSQALLDEFPQGQLVRIAGAAHPTMSLDGPCVPSIVGGFLETGIVPDTSCAGTPG